MTNDQIARRLREHASEMARNGENLYRVRAYRQAAMAVLGLNHSVEEVLANVGRAGLANVPGIGARLAETIDDYATRGVWEPTAERRVRLAAG
jgi:holliday junction DNA helicase RuvA